MMAGILYIGCFVISLGVAIFVLKDRRNVKLSKSILYSFKQKENDDLDELIEFSKTHVHKYKV